ncbi:MAG: HAD-IIIA family hydrolase [Oscillospiraceae bacterium]|nr:HAD-IIIA family hydrolase [Oscillospiraceae bacterium]
MADIAVFLDFQGTLGGNGIDDIMSLDFYPFSVEAIKKLNDNDILVIGITNQSHIAKGELTWEEYEKKLQQLKNELSNNNAHFDAVYCCPHSREDNCDCKKPKTGLINSAKNDFDIAIEQSYVVGDMGMNDMILAKNIGAQAILVLTGTGKGSMNEYRHTWQETEPDFIADNVLEAVNWILSNFRTN